MFTILTIAQMLSWVSYNDSFAFSCNQLLVELRSARRIHPRPGFAPNLLCKGIQECLRTSWRCMAGTTRASWFMHKAVSHPLFGTMFHERRICRVSIMLIQLMMITACFKNMYARQDWRVYLVPIDFSQARYLS